MRQIDHRRTAGVVLVVTINAIGGFVQILDSPARQAFVSTLVEPADLTSAVSLNGVVTNSPVAGKADNPQLPTQPIEIVRQLLGSFVELLEEDVDVARVDTDVRG